MGIGEKLSKLEAELSKLFPGLEFQVLKLGELNLGLDNFQYFYIIDIKNSIHIWF
jgi:hypothetical protein